GARGCVVGARRGASRGGRPALSPRLHARVDRGVARPAARHCQLTVAPRTGSPRGRAAMNLKRLMERVPADRDAEERAWSVVRAAYAEREPVRGGSRRRLMLASVALAVAV